MIELAIINECPNSAGAQELLGRALELEGLDPAAIKVSIIQTEQQAVDAGFHGSPSFMVDGADLFPSVGEPAVSCRVYQTANGLAGLPELERLRAALAEALQGTESRLR